MAGQFDLGDFNMESFTPSEQNTGGFTDSQSVLANMFGPQNFNSPGLHFKFQEPDFLDDVMNVATPMILGGLIGPAAGGLFGGGIAGNALGYGLTNGSLSALQGGDFGKGFLGGAVGGGLQGLAAGTPAVMGNNPSAYVPGTPGTSIAGFAGVTNPTLAGMVNRGAGSALGTLASGGNGGDVLKSGLTGAALSGINSAGKGVMDYYKNSLTDWLSPGGGSTDFADLQGSGGDMSGQTDVSPNRYDEMITGSDNMQTYNPSYDFGGAQQALDFSGSSAPDQRALSAQQPDFSLASILGTGGGKLGGMALNNVGDLASMLYGFYNNRKQSKALGQQMSSLQGLYGQNSPYAAQLRNKLNAQAAAGGRRSNTSGRETQLQAMLADRAASMAPTMMQLQQAKGSLGNNNMNMLLQGMNKLGGFKALGQGLQGLFGPQSSLTGPGSFNAYSNMDDMYGTVG